MHTEGQGSAAGGADEQAGSEANAPQPLNAIQRRILGVLIEKARTTPDSYPMSLNGLVTGCNQKSNRAPVMNLTPEAVEDELIAMRERGIVAEVHGGGRVPKYRHYGYDYMGVKGVEAGVMTELLLRGEQSVGDLRSRASRFEPIADLNALQGILRALEDKKLVIALTPPGRGQMYTHNLYEADELQSIREQVDAGAWTASSPRSSPASAGNSEELATLKQQIAELRNLVDDLVARVAELESR